MTYLVMDPSDDACWTHDWTDYLSSGDTVSSRQWKISPDTSPSKLTDDTAAIVRVKDLDKGVVYVLSEKIVSAQGETGERSLTIRCEDV